MHLRRALFLFAIVLGLAAIAASVSRPRDPANETDALRGAPPTERAPAPTVEPGASPSKTELFFDAGDPKAQRLQAGQAATVFVDVKEAGQVEIADLGVSATAEPLTPARFEVLTSATGRYRISFTPAAQDEQLDAGTLVVAAEE